MGGRFFLCLASALAARGGAKFLPPTPSAAAEAEPSHPWCSFAVSQRVRRHIEEEILKPAARAGVEAWPAGCPFDPSRDLLRDWQAGRPANRSAAAGGICLADYCAVFGVCSEGEQARREEAAGCDSAAIAAARRRCDAAVARCFPLSGEVTRRLHVQHSRQTCQVLDCGVLHESRRGREAAPLCAAALLALLLPLLLAALSGLVLGVEHSDSLLQLLVESGAASTGVARGCLQTREALRGILGFDRTKLI